jgi:hypothetical protein
LALDSAGDIVFADRGSGHVRKLTPIDFQVTAGSDTITVTAGQSGQTTLTVTPVNGFNQQVSLSFRGLADGATCSASSVTPNGAAVQTKLTIATTGASAQLHSNPGRPNGVPFYAMLLLGLAGVAGLVSCSRQPRHGIQALCFFAVLMVSSFWMAACGGGSNGSGGGGTPAGTYTIAVTSTSGPITKMNTLTLTVQ